MAQVIQLHPLNTREAYPPVDHRPAEKCGTMEYDEIMGCVGVQFAFGERHARGLHVIQTPDTDGPVVRYIEDTGAPEITVIPPTSLGDIRRYDRREVEVIGFVFQLIRNWDTGERWEFIRRGAVARADESHLARLLKATVN